MKAREVFFLLPVLLVGSACATGSAGWTGVGATWSGPEAGCPTIMSHFDDWSSKYGAGDRRRSDAPEFNKPHSGIDFDVPAGTEVLAAAPGTVAMSQDRYRGFSIYGGLTVVVYHGEDTDGKHIFTYYTHLSESNVAPGQRVARGEVIGQSGVFKFPHLHLSLFRTPVPEFWPFIMRSDRSILADPAMSWADPKRPGFDPSTTHPDKPIRMTYPLRCR